ncbi:MAG: DoxX family protein, partial [Bdellovibrionota bacterium]
MAKKNTIHSIKQKIENGLDSLVGIPPLIARITVGWVFIESGLWKFSNLDQVIGFFESIPIPMAKFQAPMVAAIELSCGALVLLGLFARWAAIPLIPIMTVAIVTVKMSDVKKFSDFFETAEYLYIVLLAWIIVSGPGLYSVDVWRKKLRAK